MQTGGVLRAQLSDTLTAAYGRGLLSEDTLATRLDCLLRDHVIDPERLVGDLHLRGPQDSLWDRLSHTMSTVRERVETLLADGDQILPSLLALDWSGAHTELLVGRSSRCDVVLGDATVSRRHARLRFRDGSWALEDLGSSNGTTLNGRRVGRCELRPGDNLLLGYFQLRID